MGVKALQIGIVGPGSIRQELVSDGEVLFHSTFLYPQLLRRFPGPHAVENTQPEGLLQPGRDSGVGFPGWDYDSSAEQ